MAENPLQTSNMKLYFAPPLASLAVLILAKEMHIALDLIEVDVDSWSLPSGEHLSQISPKNSIPILMREDGSFLTETPVILNWLAAQDPDMRFSAPAHSENSVRIDEWLAFFASEQHRLFAMLFWEIDIAAKIAIKSRIVERFQIVEAALDGKDFLVANLYSIADIYGLIMVRGAQHLIEGFFEDGQFPNLQAFSNRLTARPAVQAALKDHGCA